MTASKLVPTVRELGVPFEASGSGRWVKLLRLDAPSVYLVEYAWDQDSVCHYLVIREGEDGNELHTSLADAIGAGLSALWPIGTPVVTGSLAS